MRSTQYFSSAAGSGIHSSTTVHQLPTSEISQGGPGSSGTWTVSSGEPGLWSATDEVEDRFQFVQEYNRLAEKHGIRLLVPERPESGSGDDLSGQQKKGWFSRTFLRQPPVTTGQDCSTNPGNEKRLPPKRSVSDLAMHLVKSKRDGLKNEDLQSLVRLCGKSTLHMPSDYSPSPLVLPTCFRATAQYLVHNSANARGLFRIPGSTRIVSSLYDYYCTNDQDADIIASTTRYPGLPPHIKASVHDVASTFKKLLAGLPGGILGSLSLLDALVAIHGQLPGDSGSTATGSEQSQLRARLICLAIGTVRSQYRRELICAVFGLLNLIGRAADTASAEPERGKSRPPSDLMGYDALGIVFGPLLVGDLMNSYSMARAGNDPVILDSRTDTSRRRKSRSSEESAPRSLSIDKVHLANSVTEMVICHWREVVTHMRRLKLSRPGKEFPAITQLMQRRDRWPRPIASEIFTIKDLTEWDHLPVPSGETETSPSLMPQSTSPSTGAGSSTCPNVAGNKRNILSLRQQRSRSDQSTFNIRPWGKGLVQSFTTVAGRLSSGGTDTRPTATSRLLAVPDRFKQAATSEGSPLPPRDATVPTIHMGSGLPAKKHDRLRTSEGTAVGSSVNSLTGKRSDGLATSPIRRARAPWEPKVTASEEGSSDTRRSSILESLVRKKAKPTLGELQNPSGRDSLANNTAAGTSRTIRTPNSPSRSPGSPNLSPGHKSRPGHGRGHTAGATRTLLWYQPLPPDATPIRGAVATNKFQYPTTKALHQPPTFEVKPANFGQREAGVGQVEDISHTPRTNGQRPEHLTPRLPTNGTSWPQRDVNGTHTYQHNTHLAPNKSPSKSSRQSVSTPQASGASVWGSPQHRVKGPRSPEERALHDSEAESPKTPRTKSPQEPNSQPSNAKMGGSGVKAMTALFEKASKDPEPVRTPTLGQKLQDGDVPQGNKASPYTTGSPPSKSAKSTRSTPKMGTLASTMPPGKTLPGFSPDKDVLNSVTRESSNPESPSGLAQRASRAPTRTETLPPHTPTLKPSGPRPLTQKGRGSGRNVANTGKQATLQEVADLNSHTKLASRATGSLPGTMPPVSPISRQVPGAVETTQSKILGSKRAAQYISAETLGRSTAATVQEKTLLHRQPKIQENPMDIVVLQEQLRDAMAECEMWKERAEAAERLIETLEQSIAHSRSATGKGAKTILATTVSTEGPTKGVIGNAKKSLSGDTRRMTENHQHRTSTTPTEEDIAAAETVWKSFQALHHDSSATEKAREPIQDAHPADVTNYAADPSTAVLVVDADGATNDEKMAHSGHIRAAPTERESLVDASGIWVAAQGLLEDSENY